jgi:thiol-disulfide isomerase/thioredoxin
MSALTLALLALPTAGCSSKQRHEGPDLRTLTAEDLSGRLGQLREPLTLVHVWATWCAPCRKEFPRLLRFREAYDGRGVTMILVSADAPDKREQVARYLAEQGASFPSFIITNPNAAFINTLCTNWSGAIPASFFFGMDGKLKEWWEGEAEYDRYEETARRLLGHTDKGG